MAALRICNNVDCIRIGCSDYIVIGGWKLCVLQQAPSFLDLSYTSIFLLCPLPRAFALSRFVLTRRNPALRRFVPILLPLSRFEEKNKFSFFLIRLVVELYITAFDRNVKRRLMSNGTYKSYILGYVPFGSYLRLCTFREF